MFNFNRMLLTACSRWCPDCGVRILLRGRLNRPAHRNLLPGAMSDAVLMLVTGADAFS
jgi:hypothetical protein